jgi:hypothetical protein
MEPETHRRDREAMLAEHAAVAERVQREVDAVVAVAAAKRRAHLDWRLERARAALVADQERRRVLAGLAVPTAGGVSTGRPMTVSPGLDASRGTGPPSSGAAEI